MTPTPDEIEASLLIPEAVATGALQRKSAQDAERGEWPSPREAEQPMPPWPDENSPILRMLLVKAKMSIEAGMDPQVAMLQLAVHAWFEGGVENYDRGQRDARQAQSAQQ